MSEGKFRILIVVMGLVGVVALVSTLLIGCQSGAEQPPAPAEPTEAVSEPPTEEPIEDPVPTPEGDPEQECFEAYDGSVCTMPEGSYFTPFTTMRVRSEPTADSTFLYRAEGFQRIFAVWTAPDGSEEWVAMNDEFTHWMATRHATCTYQFVDGEENHLNACGVYDLPYE